MVTRADTATVDVTIGKLTLDWPSGTVTFAGGRPSEVSLLTSVTSTPFFGASRSSVTVPVTAFPPTTASLLSERLKRIGHNPIEFCCQLAPYAARSVLTTVACTGIDVIGDTIASVDPAGIVTNSGTSTCGRSLAIRTSAPPLGAGAFKMTRPCVECAPDTLLGTRFSQNRPRPGGVGGPATTRKFTPADHGPRTVPCTAPTRQ